MPKISVNSAPEVDETEEHTGGLVRFQASTRVAGDSLAMTHNITLADMSRPLLSAANPFERHGGSSGKPSGGLVEEYSMPAHLFEAQRRTAQLERLKDAPATVKKRLAKGDAAKVDGFLGPWAGYEGEVRDQPLVMPSEDEIANAQGPVDELMQRRKEIADTSHETSILHWKDGDFMHPAASLGRDLTRDPSAHECFPPKRLVHTWTGHTKGVNAIRFLPTTGHLLLSCSMDNRIKLWDVMSNKQCVRDYIGHEKAVRDITFTNDGKQFLSASYDKTVKLWDTETGQCVQRLSPGAIPYCIKFHPDADKQNMFLAGCSDNKILQYDLTSGEVVQTYNQHTSSINTITFIDDNKRFVSTSDDKTIRVWDWDIPVTIKYIAEPHMHSVGSVCVDPSGKFAALQSADNHILIYTAKEQFRLHRQKRFSGHTVAGFACQVNFSPDGQYLISGDAGGSFFVWDWSTGRVVRKMAKAHQQVCMGVAWHPQEPSKVATCSWDGTIKYWD